MYFPTKYLHPYPQNHPKNAFWGTFQCNAKLITQIARHKSHINGATKVKLYSYMGIGKYFGVSKFFARGVWGAQGPLMQIWDPLLSQKLLEVES